MEIIEETLQPGYRAHINIGKGTVYYLYRLESGQIVIMQEARSATAPLLDIACIGTSKQENEKQLISKARSLEVIFDTHNVPVDTMVIYRPAQFQHTPIDEPYIASVIFVAILAFKS